MQPSVGAVYHAVVPVLGGAGVAAVAHGAAAGFPLLHALGAKLMAFQAHHQALIDGGMKLQKGYAAGKMVFSWAKARADLAQINAAYSALAEKPGTKKDGKFDMRKQPARGMRELRIGLQAACDKEDMNALKHIMQSAFWAQVSDFMQTGEVEH